MIIRQGRAAVRQHCPGPQGRRPLLPLPGRNQDRSRRLPQRLAYLAVDCRPLDPQGLVLLPGLVTLCQVLGQAQQRAGLSVQGCLAPWAVIGL